MDYTEQEKRAFIDRIKDIISLINVKNPEDIETGGLLSGSPIGYVHKDKMGSVYSPISQIANSFNGAKQKTFSDLFGDFGPTPIIFEVINKSLSSKDIIGKFGEVLDIKTYLNSEEIDQTALFIAEEIFSYPHRYELFVKSPRIDINNFNPDLSAQVTLIRAGQDYISRYKVPDQVSATGALQAVMENWRISSNVALAREMESLKLSVLSDPSLNYRSIFWEENTPYIRLAVDGYIPPYGRSNTESRALDLLFGTAGLAIAINLITESQELRQRLETAESLTSLQLPYPVFDVTKQGISFVRWLWIPENVSELLQKLQPEIWEQDRINAVDNIVRTHLRKNDLGKISNRLMVASRWYFESRCDRNQTHAFLHAIIGLEVALDGKSIDQYITKRLADRYAYLVSGSAVFREKARKQFEKLYEHRSSIVHKGDVLLPEASYKELAEAQIALKTVVGLEANRYWATIKREKAAKTQS